MALKKNTIKILPTKWIYSTKRFSWFKLCWTPTSI